MAVHNQVRGGAGARNGRSYRAGDVALGGECPKEINCKRHLMGSIVLPFYRKLTLTGNLSIIDFQRKRRRWPCHSCG